MSNVVIEIQKGFANGDLQLSDNGYSCIPMGSSIKWKIKDSSDDDSIQVVFFNIQIKEESNDEIFSENPVKEGREWKAKIKTRDVEDKTCKYGIFWEDKKGNGYYFDPIIAVRPTPPLEKNLLLGIAIAVVALITLQLFRKKRHASKFQRFPITPQ